MGTDIKSPQSTTSNISTHSMQSNHSTVSTDSMGYGRYLSSALNTSRFLFSLHRFRIRTYSRVHVCPSVVRCARCTNVSFTILLRAFKKILLPIVEFFSVFYSFNTSTTFHVFRPRALKRYHEGSCVEGFACSSLCYRL